MPNSNKPAVDGAEKVLDNLKMESAKELGLDDDDIDNRGRANMTTKEAGSIGDSVTKKLFEYAVEHNMKDGK
jgi:hypothetical protein